MHIDVITSPNVRDALRAIVYSKPLERNPLIDLAIVTRGLRAAGQPATTKSRAWMLSEVLAATIDRGLSAARTGTAVDAALSGSQPSLEEPASSGDWQADFRAASPELEAWATLRLRYFRPDPPQMNELADELATTPRTLRRRLSRGYELLARALRERELEERERAEHQRKAPARQRGRGSRATLAPTDDSESRTPHGSGRTAGHLDDSQHVPDGPPDGAEPGNTGATHAPPNRGNVRPSLDRFIGREEDLRALLSLLADRPVVTLVGPGGIGKSRLARQAAVKLTDVRPHGAWWAPLAGVEDPDRVRSSLAASLEELLDGWDGDDLTAALHDIDALIVIDNCEHVRTTVAREVTNLAAHCPSLTILATSREPLGVEGERLLRLEPLATDAAADGEATSPAARLFIDRVRSFDPTFAPPFDPPDAAATAVADICRMVDGIPLAVELAAAAARTVPVVQLAERLRQGLPVEPGVSGTGPERHRTMASAIAWTWERLSEPERTAFRRLSVFRAPFRLEAATTIIAGPSDASSTTREDSIGEVAIGEDEAVVLLSRLADRSMVMAPMPGDADGYYRILGPLRAYGRSQLESDGNPTSIRQRHARYFAGVAEAAEDGLVTDDELRWLERLDAVRDDLHAAFDWACDHDPSSALRIAGALGQYWTMRGLLDTGRAQLERALAVSEATPAAPSDAGSKGTDEHWIAHRIKLMIQAARLARQQSELEIAGQLAGAARDLADASDDLGGRAAAERELGIVADESGRYDDAAAHYQSALRAYRRLEDEWGMAAVLNNIGLLAQHRGRPEQAVVPLEKSLALFRNLGETWAEGVTLANLAGLAGDLERFDQADERYRQALDIARELEDPVGVGSILAGLAYVQYRKGDLDAAYSSLEDALPLLEDAGDLQKSAEALATLAWVELARGRREEAAVAYEMAAQILADTDVVMAAKEEREWDRLGRELGHGG